MAEEIVRWGGRIFAQTRVLERRVADRAQQPGTAKEAGKGGTRRA